MPKRYLTSPQVSRLNSRVHSPRVTFKIVPLWLSMTLVLGAILGACDSRSYPTERERETVGGVSRSMSGDLLDDVGGSRGGAVSVDSAGVESGAGAGGGTGAGSDTASARDVELAPAMMARLSASEINASIEQLFGIAPQSQLETDTRLHGFTRVANSELSLSPLFVEQLETLAWEVADHLTTTPERLDALFPCGERAHVEALVGARRDRYESCVRASFVRLGGRVWRRPVSADELDAFMNVYTQVSEYYPQPAEGRVNALGALVAGLIQAPDFVFRVEAGEPDINTMSGERSGAGLSEPAPIVVRAPTWRYTGDEMASRLSYLLWGSTPDVALLEAADAGELTTRAGVRAQAERLLLDPRASIHLAGFFDELIGLPNLDAVTKDPALFPEFSQELRDSMRAEVTGLFRDVVFERNADVRELLTSERAHLDVGLAEIYGVSPPLGLAPGERFVVDLPLDQARGGLLGRAAPLTLFSHATVNSPTFRGRFVRSGLLCQDVPPPPEGVITELESAEGEGQTLRQRLERHANDPTCAGCHRLMDPLGFPLERFDPIGRWRDSDHGLPLDTSGELDGVSVSDARALGAAVAGSPYYVECLTRKLYRFAVGHLETSGELALVYALTDHLTSAAEHRLSGLLIELILSDGFRRLAPPLEGNGGGLERCNGVDDDRDGLTDEAVARACDASCDRDGIERCVDGDWGECEVGPPPEEVCDGLDNDCDGVVDEDVEAETERCDGRDNDCDGVIDEEVKASVHDVSFIDLSGHHPECQDSGSDASSCNAAINRFCDTLGCGGSGFGPVERNGWSARVICAPRVDVELSSVAYLDLAAEHEACDGQREEIGPNCNAAIHRYCRAQGLRTGFGPIERSSTHASIACVPNADVIQTSYTELSTHHASCQASAERIGAHCNAAIHRLCQARGYLSGWGPLENYQDNAFIGCLR